MAALAGRVCWRFLEFSNDINAICAIWCCFRVLRDLRKLDGKGKATPSGARKWLIGLEFIVIRSRQADGGKGTFLKEFNAPAAIRCRGADSLA
jgi:hypothetical protein